MRITVILVDSQGNATVQQESPKRPIQMDDAEFINKISEALGKINASGQYTAAC